ncbi:MAG: histidine kinase [Bacteroidetes bacterium]|nr:histidine kinase [Bacteroidota bacterium]
MRKLLVLWILIVVGWTACAQRPLRFNGSMHQNPQVQFIRYNTDNGLSHNTVTDILQDQSGFVWIATTDGLNRFDGRTFEVFKHNPDNFTSISASHISALALARNGSLFVGTLSGLNLYLPENNGFECVEIKSDSLDFTHTYVRALLFENDSVLWIDFQSGNLISFNIFSRKIISAHQHTSSVQPYYLYHDLYFDSNNRLWIGVRSVDVMYLDDKRQKISYIRANVLDFTKKRAADVACYFEDSNNNFWVTGLDGVYLFDRASETFEKFIGITTYDIWEDRSGNLWFATGSGLLRYEPDSETMVQFLNEKDNPNSLVDNHVLKIFEDRAGNLWFATDGGVNVYNPPAFPFGTYTHIPGIENSPEGYVVTAVAEDKNNNLWVGYEEDGLDFFSPESQSFQHISVDNNSGSGLADNHISALYIDDQYRLWIGLWKGIGFNLYEPDLERFSLFTYYPGSLEKDWYADFCEDSSGVFYVGFWGADGLVTFDRKKQTFGSSLQHRFERIICSRLITRLLTDSRNTIWIGTTDCGLHRYFPDGDSARSYFADGNPVTGLLSNAVGDIHEDKYGRIWLLTSTLQRYDPDSDLFVDYGEQLGVFTDKPISLLSDSIGNLWIGTEGNGLLKFNPDDFSGSQFFKQDGLQGNTFTKARYRLSDGRLFFGGVNGFNFFNPMDIKEPTFLPEPMFGRLFVYDHIYSHDLNYLDKVVLDPESKVFTVELNSTDLVNSERYLYQCKLLGLDQNWVDIDNTQRKVRYAGLSPGKYQLVYRLGDRYGNWTTQVATIEFVLEKPYYQTIWFLLLLIFVLMSLLYFYVMRREYELKLKNRAVELQQKIFRLQMNPHFVGNALLAIQNYIYLHNPLEAGNYLSDFAKLFRLILNNSKHEFITLSKELETLDLYLKLQSLRFPDKFVYRFEIDDQIDPESYMIPPMLAQPMIENALEHGLFKKQGRGTLIIRFLYRKDHFLFEVDDDGIGLTAALKISSGNTVHKSSALTITKERIAMLGKKYGFIVIFDLQEKYSQKGIVSGTVVRFTLPFRQAFNM